MSRAQTTTTGKRIISAIARRPVPSTPAFVAACIRIIRSGIRMTPMHAIRMKAVPAMTKNELITTAMSILGPRQVRPLDVTRKDHRAHKSNEAHDQAHLEKHRLIRCNCVHDGETDADVSEQVYRHHTIGERRPDDDAIRHQQKTNDV